MTSENRSLDDLLPKIHDLREQGYTWETILTILELPQTRIMLNRVAKKYLESHNS